MGDRGPNKMPRRNRVEGNEPMRSKSGRGIFKKPERSAVGVCTKYTLFFENFFLVILGLGMTALGAYILVLKDKVVASPLDFFLDPACDMCLAGAIVFFMGFFGCMGALREIVCFLKVYYVSLCLVLLAELALAVLLFVSYYMPEVKGTVFPKDAFNDAILNYRNDPDMQHLIDTLQQELGCCGMSDSEKGFMDWNDNVYFNCSISNLSPEACSVPYTCCKTELGGNINYRCGAKVIKYLSDGEILPNEAFTSNINTDGCIKALGDWINEHALVVGGVMLGILLPQVFIVVLTRNLIEMIQIQKSHW